VVIQQLLTGYKWLEFGGYVLIFN